VSTNRAHGTGSPRRWEQYEATGGKEGGTLEGAAVRDPHDEGRKTGKLRKTPLMRIEHEGVYAVVAVARWRAAAPGLVP